MRRADQDDGVLHCRPRLPYAILRCQRQILRYRRQSTCNNYLPELAASQFARRIGAPDADLPQNLGEYITTAKINVLPAITDTTAASGIDAATILSEVCATIAAKGLKPTVNDYYPVYVDTPHVKGNSCAYHSYGTCSGTVVQFGFHSNFDGEVADATGRGCSAGSTPTVSQGANSLVNATAHELWETVTDPRGNYLYDSFGSEGSDKCAWILSTVGAWNIQAEWSNAAFTAGSGAPNSSGQKACVWSR